jgi:TatD DNase family protein
MLIDSHCHLYYKPYIDKIQDTINICKKHNVLKLLSISVDLKTSKKNIDLCNKYKEIFCTIGIHPNEVSNTENCNILELNNIYKNSNKILGIGEIGLDFFKNRNFKDQENYFIKQIEIALNLKLPIVIHSREAEKATINILKKYMSSNLKFVVHCFTGTRAFAENIINLGGYVSFGGILTFKNSNSLRSICKDIPLENILIETDSPYLSPHPFRGKINCPSNVRYIVDTISTIKEISFDKIELQTEKNFEYLFGLN